MFNQVLEKQCKNKKNRLHFMLIKRNRFLKQKKYMFFPSG